MKILQFNNIRQEGLITAWQKHCRTGEVTKKELHYKITLSERMSGKPWVVFQLFGGPTGFESFVLDDMGGPEGMRHGPVWPDPYWPACAGTDNSWHQLRVHKSEMTRVLTQYFKNNPNP